MKERLTGAIILVVLIVLLVPELLSGPKGSVTPPAAAASTASEEPPLRSYTINLGDDSHPRTAGSGTSGPAMPQPTAPEAPDQSLGAASSSAADTGPQSASPVQQPPAPSSKPDSATPAPSAPQHSSVPVPKASAPAPKPTPPTKTHPALKVPAPQKSGGTEKPAPAEKPSASTAAGWSVQLGVFASHENAERLAQEVRGKGFKASVSVTASGGRKLYRVRVGPASDRNAAQELQGKLKASGHPGGTVVPYP